MIIDLNLYGLETIIHDIKAFPPGMAETLLEETINKMEVNIFLILMLYYYSYLKNIYIYKKIKDINKQKYI